MPKNKTRAKLITELEELQKLAAEPLNTAFEESDAIEALIKENKFFNSIFDSWDGPIYVTDRDKLNIIIYDDFGGVRQRDRSELLKKTHTELYGDETVKILQAENTK